MLASSCVSTNYLPSRIYLLSPPKTQDHLLIFLPGRRSGIHAFESHGTLDILRSSGIQADCVSVDATLSYYTDRVLVDRLETDVFKKAEITGYKNYWFIGNSLGALGAIFYAQTHPGKIKGIILLGPYLGEGPVPDEIQKSGGLLKWEPNMDPGKDSIQDAWVFLRNCITDSTGNFPTIVFLAGQDDRYHQIHSLVAEALPADRVFWAPSRHDWVAWKAAFSEFLHSETAKKLFSKQTLQQPK
jgi:pimeloyl-ACP methyl ester carboxylesterase